MPDFSRQSLSYPAQSQAFLFSKDRQRLLMLLLTLLSCVCLPFALLPQRVHAATLATGHISGQLLNGSQNNAPVANQSVTLQMAQGNSARDLITITTDAQGRYNFSALQSDSSVQYAVYTLYQGAQYYTDLLDLSKKSAQQVNLTVYNATTSIENIAVVQASILLSKVNPQSGMITISEDFFFENLNKTTYVGSLDASAGKPNALLFQLPTGARFLSLETGFDGYHNIQVDTGFATNAAITPGTSRFSFSFQVPYSGSAYDFSYQAVYPTVELSVLTPLNLLTTTQGLDSQGPTNAQSATYQLFQTKTLEAGKSVEAHLQGLPIPTKATAAPTTTNTNMIWLIALLILLIALTGVATYIYRTRRRRAAIRAKQKTATRRNTTTLPGKKRSPQTTKETLLRQLLELDKAYETGKLKKAAYQEQRKQTKERLRTLMSEQPEATTSGRVSGKGNK